MAQDAPTFEDDHPIVAAAVALFDVEDGKYILSERGMNELSQQMDALVASWELPLAVDSLLRLAHVLEADWSSPQAAAAVCDVIERDSVLDGLKALTQELREQLEASAPDEDPLEKFAGGAAKKAPLKVGETPPEGAVKLDAFKAPRRV
jgi:hypothetical protein